ncbi:hypothetical protein PsYK624_101030 [Phanerochaete sordida]|uniref:Uncharacterized protein n=1 Tax=Phanerochaete sordida TaxID=48140 RepID=A0A9P3GFG1_9APHY|nr:hypothetical protein PsYK624_101030 [Phanerochaete sordida]
MFPSSMSSSPPGLPGPEASLRDETSFSAVLAKCIHLDCQESGNREVGAVVRVDQVRSQGSPGAARTLAAYVSSRGRGRLCAAASARLSFCPAMCRTKSWHVRRRGDP